MTVQPQPLSEVTHAAVSVLIRELGMARTLRFLGQYRTGWGDYTTEREHFLSDVPLEELVEQAQQLDQEQNA